jgi:hypothetical protein
MSKCHQEPIECPYCGAPGEYTLWDSVNVDLDSDLRDKIFSEDLFLWKCPQCGKEIHIPFGTLYHDMKNKFMLMYEYYDPDEGKYEPMKISAPLELSKDYTMRVVYGLMNLKEKIVILEHGLNDIAIEHMKYMISHLTCPEISEKGYVLYFHHIEEPTEEFPYGTIFFFYEDAEKEQLMTIRFAMDNYYEHCMAVDVDPRFNIGDKCICIDSGYMDINLRKAGL